MRVQSGHRHLWWLRAWWSKNPLLRPPTGAQRLSTVGAVVLCLVLALSVPVITLLTWNATSARITPAQEIHTVQATVTTPRDSAALARAPMAIPAQQTVQWWWNGERHTGQLPSATATAQDDVRTVRVDEHGELLSSRFGTGDAVTFTILATMAAAATALGLTLAALRLRSRWLLHRHAQTWEREWERFQPMWTGRGYKT